LKIAYIDRQKCTDCKKCIESCKFDAINDKIEILRESCEGCSVCAYVCPVDAITMVKRKSGFAYISETRFGPMSHADLITAEEASGKLVSLVRENAKDIAKKKGKELILIDGPPGIGCPVIASISGVDLVLIVTEPTLSAIHDLERIIGVAKHFKIPVFVCINKYDINLDNSKKIEVYCKKNHIEIVGQIPYDNIVSEAMVNEKSVVEFSNGNLSKAIIEMWSKLKVSLT
jgi:MinD superfamily P-loop ATPase